LPTDAEEVFDAHAGTSLAAQVTFTNEMNAGVIPGINAAILDVTNKAESAASSANAAAASAGQALNSQSAAAVLAQTAQIAAAASGASAGIGQLGNPGDSLQVNAARTGLVFGQSDGKVGDVLISARNPGPLFVQANGGIRAQSALPSLLGMLGYLGGQVGQQYATVSAGATTTVVDVASAPNPNGGSPRVMQLAANGGVNFSYDGGVTWVARTAPTSAPGGGISYDEVNNLWIVTNNTTGFIYLSSDDGLTWQTTGGSVAGLSGGFNRVVPDASGVWIAIANLAHTTVWRSTDKGSTWAAITIGPSGVYVALSTDNKGVWCAASGSSFKRSIDGGLTWVTQFTSAGAISAIANDRNGTWLISGTSSNTSTYKSVDNGVTWTLLATPVTSTVTDIAYSQGFFFLVRNVSPQLIMISSAADATVYTVPTGAVLASLIKVTATAGYVVAVNSVNTTVLRSAPIFAYDTSSQFQLPNFPVATGLQAWVKAGLAMLSSGKSFTSGSIIGVSPGTSGMDTDGNGVIIAVGSSTIRRSTDYGATWVTVTNPAATALYSIATDGKGLWIVGGSVTILRSTDNGKTFTTVPFANHGFSTGGVGQVVIGKDGVMLGFPLSATVAPRKSVDGGLNWTGVAGVTSATIARAATDGLGRWIIAQGASAFTSTDNGVTFGAAIATGLSGTVVSVVMTLFGRALITGTTTTGRYSSNYGEFWSSDLPMPLASMNLLRGPGQTVLAFSISGSKPYISDRLQSTLNNFVASTILGASPTSIAAAAGGSGVPFIMAGVVSTDRVFYNGTLDTPV
jgi:photosystem II stability/assembly factor-like uncharacterized protein